MAVIKTFDNPYKYIKVSDTLILIIIYCLSYICVLKECDLLLGIF